MKKPNKGKIITAKTSDSLAAKPVTTKKSLFRIVGIGASAGGLEALEQFFENMPKDSGMAFVVIQHLDPTYKGIMPELLQRITKMKVIAVTDQLEITPNCVYVIPPNKSMSILKGVLHLFAPIETKGLRLPIDFFFHSLAIDRHEQSVGIILSGMGSDGSLGLKAIKEKAGIVLVQSPESAKFDSMPRAAIKAVTIDILAPANELPKKLLSITKFSNRKNDTATVAKDSSSLEKIIILLRTRTKNDFSQYKENTMYRRIERRMAIHQIDKITSYVRYLRENPSEVEILFKELLIGVTSFFRDVEVWKFLKNKTLPNIFETSEDGKIIRAWVPACSTGEEAYSWAMIFKEAIEKAKPNKGLTLQVFATDLNAGAIEQARKGIYSDSIVADMSATRLNRFFVKIDNGYKLKNEIREMVVFAEQNVIKDPPFSQLDILSCRNMMIYMQRDLQIKLVSLFHYALNSSGILVLGSAETNGDSKEFFVNIDSKLHIYQSTGSVKPEMLFNFPSAFEQTQKNSNKNSNKNQAMPEISDAIKTHADNLLLQQFMPASVLIGDQGDILYLTGNTGKYLTPAAGKASMNIFTMAREGLRDELPVAIRKAKKNDGKLILRGIKVGSNGGTQIVDVSIQKIETPVDLKGKIMVVFSDVTLETQKARKNKESPTSLSLKKQFEQEKQRFKEELQSINEEMQTSQEELKSTNEELQSSNEELQSANEELTTSKEEMQSLNEELHTVNAELLSKVEDSERVTNDMNNLLNSNEIATLFLDRKLNIRQYTEHATKIFKLISSDIGRHYTDLANNLEYPDMLVDAKEVLRTLVFVEKIIASSNGLYYVIRIMPYRTFEDKIDGLVITFIDITESKLSEISLIKAKKQYNDLFNSMIQMFQVIELIYDSDGKPSDYYYRDVNPSFEKLVSKTRKQLIDKRCKDIFGIIEDHWLEAYDGVMKTGKSIVFENYGAELNKYYKVNAWKTSDDKVAVTFTDITKRKLSQIALLETQTALKTFITKVPEVIIGLSSNGEIIEFNQEAEKVFKRKRNKVVGENYFDLFISKSERKKVESEMKSILSAGVSNRLENLVKLANGNQIKIEWAAHKLYDKKGDLIGIIAIGENIITI